MAKKERRSMRKQTERNQSMWKQFCKKANIGSISAAAGVAALGIALLIAVFSPSVRNVMVEKGLVKEAIHTHQASCYTTFSVLTCTEEEGENHTHSQDCYEDRPLLTCGKAEHTEEAAAPAEISIPENILVNSENSENADADVSENNQAANSALDKSQEEAAVKAPVLNKKYQEEAERLIAEARNAYAKQSTKWNTAIIEKTVSKDSGNKTESKPQSQPAQTENQSVIIGGGIDAVEFGGTASTSVTTTINPTGGSASGTSGAGSNKETKTITTFKKGVDLSALFVSWCIKEAEVSTWALDEDSYVSGDKVSKLENDLDSILHYAFVTQLPKDRLPVAGELVFIDENEDEVSDLVGIITTVKNGKVTYLTANKEGEVVEAVETMGTSELFAYGLLDNAVINSFEEYYDVSFLADGEEDPHVKYLFADFSTDKDPIQDKYEDGTQKITKWILSVELTQPDGSKKWANVNHADFEYTGNERFKLGVDYRIDRKYFEIAGEKNPNRLLYVKLPLYLQSVLDSKGTNVKYGNETVGKMYTEQGYARIQIDEAALTYLPQEIVSGSFESEFLLDVSFLPPDASSSAIGGNLINYIKNNQDLIARTGKLEVDKQASELQYPGKSGYRQLPGYENKAYVPYTVTVNAPNDGVTMPDVKVLDQVAAPNNRYVLAYAGVSGTSSTVGNNPNASATKSVNGGATTQDTSSSLYLTKVTNTEATDFAMPAGSAADAKNDAMVWNIGAMAPHESRTLQYYLILDNYTGYAHPASENNFKNKAEVYSKQYIQGEKEAIVTTKAAMNLTKELVGNTHTVDANGDYILSYKLTLTAPADNSYPMQNLRIYDEFNSGTIGNQNVSYILNTNGQHDKWILKKNGVVQNYKDTAMPDGKNTVSNPKIGSHDMTFYPTDPLAPGETYTLEYTMKVKKEGVFGGEQSQKSINNHAQVHDDGNTPVKGTVVANANNSYTLSETVWERKSSGMPVADADRTVTMKASDEFYAVNGAGWSKVNAPSAIYFEVPAGGLKYQVVVNESTDWNVTGAAFHDQMMGSFEGKLIYHFTGWMQVNLYNDKFTGGSDEEAIAFYASKTPVKTIWLNIDDAASFDVKPSDIGVSDGNYAYLLTYYTKINEGNFSGNFDTTNEFSMSGNVVGPGGTRVPLNGIKVKKTHTTTGNFSYQSIKHPWYYMSPSNQRTDVVNYPNGEMYWLLEVKVKGGKLLQDTVIRDSVGSDLVLKDSALMGVFVGNSINLAEGQKLSDVYPSLDNFRASSGLTALNRNLDFTTQLNNNALQITLSKDTSIGNGKSLLLVVRTMPSSLPSQMGKGVAVYTNKMSVKTPGKNFDPDTTATQDIIEDYSMTKEGQNAYIVSGTEAAPVFTKMDGKKTQPADTELPKKLWKNYPEGTTGQFNANSGNFTYEQGASYVSWLLTVNAEMDMEGAFTVIDSLPEGVELAYVRSYKTTMWPGDYESAYTGSTINGSYSLGKLDENNANGSVRLAQRYGDASNLTDSQRNAWTFTGLNPSAAADGWNLNWVLAKCDGASNNANRTLTLYYTKGNQVMIYIPRIYRNVPDAHKSIFQFQIVCKVTKELNKQEQTDVEFVNTAKLYGGTNLDKSLKQVNAPLSLVYPSLSKKLAIENINSGKVDTTQIPFEVEINPYAEDLSPDSNTVTLIDEMGYSLTFVPSSLKITNLADNTLLDSDSYSAEFNELGYLHILKISVPDKMHLKVAYDVILKAVPGMPISVNNQVRWEGQEAADIGSVDYEIEYSTAAKVDGTVALAISKVDNENVSLMLDGAQFKVSKVKTKDVSQGTNPALEILFKDGEPELDTTIFAPMTTSTNGVYQFINSDTNTLRQLEYDTVYCVEEIAAPSGYKLGTEKYYFAVGKNNADGYYEFIGKDKIQNWYYQTDYNPTVNITIYNTKGLAKVEKAFGQNIDAENGAGTYRFGIWQADKVTVNGGVAEKPKQSDCKDTTVITYTEEEVTKLLEGEIAPKQGTFVNLQPGQDYYIFELDENFEAIVEGKTAKTNGHQYTVSYTATNDMEAAAPTTGNKVHIGAINTTEIGKVVVNNAMYKLGVEKKFADANGTLLPAGLTGTYNFGLWSSDHTDAAGIPTGAYLNTPDQIASVTWEAEDADQSKVAEFEGLVKGAKYYVYELNKDGKPILNGTTAAVNGIQFYVLYEGENAAMTVAENYAGPTKAITNTAIVSLPDTGGVGTKWFTILGLALMGLAGICFMFKKYRKFLLFGLALCLCASLYVLPAQAAVTYTVQIQNDAPGHEYVAYQIFKGDLLDADGQVSFSNVEWGKNIDGPRFLSALKADQAFMVSGHNLFASCTTPAEVMERLSLCNKMQLVAQHASECLQNVANTTKVSTSNAGVYQMTFSEAGYYLFLDNVKEGASLEAGDSLSKYMMKVVESVIMTPKNQEIPTIEKKVLESNDSVSAAPTFTMGDTANAMLTSMFGKTWLDAVDYDMSDEIVYRIQIDLPTNGDLNSGAEGGGFNFYKNYRIEVVDTLSPGLTLQEASPRIFIGNGTSAAGYREITSEISTADGHGDVINPAGIHKSFSGNVLRFQINNVKADNIGAQGGDRIYIFYKCNLNTKANIGEAGNPNTVSMKYSNNPNANTLGETEEDTNVVFTYTFRVNKVDGEEKPLTGADFRLDKYYASYTVPDPGTGKAAFYDDTFQVGKGRIWIDSATEKYFKNTVTKEVVKASAAPGTNWIEIPTKIEFDTVDNVWVEEQTKTVTGAIFVFPGIDDGTYLLTETVTPTNYNSIDPITFQVVSTKAQDPAKPELTGLQITGEGGLVLQGFAVDKDSTSASITATIQNTKGSRLPSTGGRGTTLIYILGILLVVGAGAALVVKARMDRK